MTKLQVAVIGLGRLGRACAEALIDESELGLAGIVRRPGAHGALTGRLQRFPVASHVSELARGRAALVCVPADVVLGVACELLQARIPIVECACLEGKAPEAHHTALDAAADQHRVAAVVGAGWDSGVLPLMRSAFEMLIPRGQIVFHRHPGLNLHHTVAVPPTARTRAGSSKPASNSPLSRRASCSTPCAGIPAMRNPSRAQDFRRTLEGRNPLTGLISGI